MTNDQELEFIQKEVEWTKKIADEKFGEMILAERRYKEAKFRADITEKALQDFLNKKEQ